MGDRGSAQETYRAVSPLMTLYAVIVGLALTEGLTRFLRLGTPNWPNSALRSMLRALPLFVVFVSTLARFFHGALLHVELCYRPGAGYLKYRGGSALLDFLGFAVEGALFFVMSVLLFRPRAFLVSYALVAGVDVVWALLSESAMQLPESPGRRHAKTWWHLNLVVCVFLLVLFWLDRWARFPGWIVGWSIFGAVAVVTYLDYKTLWNFYFGLEKADSEVPKTKIRAG